MQSGLTAVQEEREANDKRRADVDGFLKRALKLAQKRQDQNKAVKANKAPPSAPPAPGLSEAALGSARNPLAQPPATASTPWERGKPTGVGVAQRVDEAAGGGRAAIKELTSSAVFHEITRGAVPHKAENAFSALPQVLCELQQCEMMLPVRIGESADAAALRRAVRDAFAGIGHAVPETHVLVAVDAAGEAMAVSDAAPWKHTQQTTVALKLLEPGS
jgi:hypothetical protein